MDSAPATPATPAIDTGAALDATTAELLAFVDRRAAARIAAATGLRGVPVTARAVACARVAGRLVTVFAVRVAASPVVQYRAVLDRVGPSFATVEDALAVVAAVVPMAAVVPTTH